MLVFNDSKIKCIINQMYLINVQEQTFQLLVINPMAKDAVQSTMIAQVIVTASL